jgi:hypothetical protein
VTVLSDPASEPRWLFFFLCFFFGSTASMSTSLARRLSPPLGLLWECDVSEECRRRERWEEDPIWETESLGTMVSRSSLSEGPVSFSEEDGYASATTLRPKTEVRALEVRDVRECGGDTLTTGGASLSDSGIRPSPEAEARVGERE